MDDLTPGAYPEIWIRGGVKGWGLLPFPFPFPSTTLISPPSLRSRPP